jgi:hypothetical protein
MQDVIARDKLDIADFQDHVQSLSSGNVFQNLHSFLLPATRSKQVSMQAQWRTCPTAAAARQYSRSARVILRSTDPSAK